MCVTWTGSSCACMRRRAPSPCGRGARRRFARCAPRCRARCRAVRFLTAGESHGPGLVALVDGVPAGLALSPAEIDVDLRRRQLGYGRGARQSIERDAVRITGGGPAGGATRAPPPPPIAEPAPA